MYTFGYNSYSNIVTKNIWLQDIEFSPFKLVCKPQSNTITRQWVILLEDNYISFLKKW